MNAKKLFLGAVITFTAITGTAMSAKAVNIVQNGSFENPGTAPSSYLTLPDGSTAINGWTVGPGSIDYVGTLWQASNGTNSVDLSALAPGGIYQQLTTVPGKTYTLTFDLAGNPGGLGGPLKTARVSAAGQSADFTFDTTGKNYSNMGWLPQSWTFTANSTTTTLSFATFSPNSADGPAIDNVSIDVAAIPEPSTLGGALLGLVMLRAMTKRKNKF